MVTPSTTGPAAEFQSWAGTSVVRFGCRWIRNGVERTTPSTSSRTSLNWEALVEGNKLRSERLRYVTRARPADNNI